MEEFVVALANVFGNCLEWFVDVFIGSGAGGFYLGCVSVYLTYKFLLAPVFGDHRSDKARKGPYRKDSYE